ncbi:CHAD domain-containing protein [Zooshikella marina]|uniref:CHAD domain-containing protein n=1 Tax=Zooshikella ganghwensis TaxID=202772 RepID=UPI001BB0B5DC|nr:CHAD domain-containing protein [Zooshikella ganghwensis]MBU2705703.1 CHAD domain-containing protein [Zooshikella ganghwensis]
MERQLLRYHLPKRFSANKLQQLLSAKYQIYQHVLPSQTLIFYDTFEWLLWKKGLICWYFQNQLSLQWLDYFTSPYDLYALDSLELTSPPNILHLPPSTFAHKVQKIIKARALTPTAEVLFTSTLFDCKDSEEKTRVRLQLDILQPPSQAKPKVKSLIVQPLKGYTADANFCQQLLTQNQCNKTSQTLLDEMEAEGLILPSSYSIKPSFNLTPELSVHDVIAKVTSQLLTLARLNEAGIVDDIDIEFLHDYRVAIRKIRSLITLLKHAFTAEKFNELKTSFGELGKQTNMLRDLDVYLNHQADFAQLLPDSLQTGLHVLFTDFQQARAQEHNKIKKHLKSRNYLRQIKHLETQFQSSTSLCHGPLANEPILKAAKDRIYRQYHVIRKKSRRITPETPDEHIHDIRIACKKLRYLLEFFADLFPTNEITKLVSALKKLQDHLGLFNDLCVQQEFLQEYYHKELKKARHPAEENYQLCLSVGGVIAALYQKQLQVRKKVTDHLSLFIDKDVRQQISHLFSTAEGEIKHENTCELQH